MNSRNQPVTVVVPGDLHLTEPGLHNHRTALWVADEVNELIRPDFVQFIGDNVQDGTEAQFDLFAGLTARLRVPWFALVGDHDAQGDGRAARFRACVGEPCGVLALYGFRFVRLNTQAARPVGLSPDQVAWFRDEVGAALAAGERPVLFQHNYPYKVWEDFAGPGVDDWRAVVQTRRIAAIVTGHTHYGQVANDGRNVVVATRSIGAPEGGPPGYTLLYLRGDDLAVTYRTVEDRGPLVLVTHLREALLATGPAHVVRGPDHLHVRVWSREPVEAVHCRVDDGREAALAPAGPQDWVAPLAGDRLAKGTHRVTVRAVDGRGRVGEQAVEFAVDPTGRYAAVPRVRPEVAGTNFC
jgi:3',5'-cyclic-AMP phosphodiesterase